MRTQVLVIDDDDRLLRLLRRLLTSAGHGVSTAMAGIEGLALAEEDEPDLVILDVMLPGMDGLEICRRLRARSSVPILMLTGLATDDDCVRGLDAGADAYLTKPFSVEVLLAHVRALLRRTREAPHLVESAPVDLSYADLTLHTGRHQATRGTRTVDLGTLEYRLLRLFLEFPEQVLSRERLVTVVWDTHYHNTSDALASQVYALRAKLEQEGLPRLIHTVRGSGYILRR